MGSVTPLLALYDILREKYRCFWIGSFNGIEKRLIKSDALTYLAIPSGKLRRYFSFRNIFEPFFIFAGFIFSLVYLIIHRPMATVVSGSFISVPLVWAGWLLRIPIVVHQEDINIGLAARLTVPFATAVTTAFQKTLQGIKNKNKQWIGNPVRNIFFFANGAAARVKWKSSELPLVLVLGGGLGSQKINDAIVGIAHRLADSCQIIHIVGRSKTDLPRTANYRQMEFLGDELAEMMSAADLIVSRAGLSTLSEIAAAGKPSILIPLASVGQTANALYFAERGAAILLKEKNIGGLEEKILDILSDKEQRDKIVANVKAIFPPNAAEKLSFLVDKICAR